MLFLLNLLQNYVVTFELKTLRQLDVEDSRLVRVCVDADVVVFLFAGFEGWQGEGADGLLSLYFLNGLSSW